MTRKSLITTLIVVGVIALLAIPKLLPKKNEQKAGGPGKGPGPIKVSVYVVKKQNLSKTIQAVGNILANEEVELRSETQGRVVKILFKEGQPVSKGQLLVKINDADLQAQLKKALATQKLKEETELRNRKLLEKGGVSQEAYDMARTDLNGINADIDLLKEQIRKTEIIAPFSGKIGLRSISEGSTITNSNIVARLQELDRLKIEFSIPEKYAPLVAIGNHISFTVEGRDDHFIASIYAIEPKVDPVSRNIVMRALCENHDGKLIPGGFAKIELKLQDNPNAFLIPTESVVPILKGQKVFLVQADSVVEQKIEIGERTDINVQVTKGLSEGDSVVVQGVIQMKQGAKVKLK